MRASRTPDGRGQATDPFGEMEWRGVVEGRRDGRGSEPEPVRVRSALRAGAEAMSVDALPQIVPSWREWSDRHSGLRSDIDRAHAALYEAIQAWNQIADDAADVAQSVVNAQPEEWQASDEGRAVQAWINRLDESAVEAPPCPWGKR